MSEIEHPRHYNVHPSGVEAILLCEQMMFNTGNAVKYLMRAGEKTPDVAVKKRAPSVERVAFSSFLAPATAALPPVSAKASVSARTATIWAKGSTWPPPSGRR